MKHLHQLLGAIILSLICVISISASETAYTGEIPIGNLMGHVPCGEILPGGVPCGGFAAALSFLQSMIDLP